MINDPERFDLEVLRGAVRYQRWVLSSFRVPIGGEILEVGAGIGNFTPLLRERARRLTALEMDPQLASEIEALALPDVTVVATSIEAMPGEDAFDAAVLLNVLEHIEDDVGALRHVVRLLKPGGYVGVLVPAHQLLYGSLDGKYAHHRRYSRTGVIDALRQAGFAQIRARYFNPVGALGWFVANRILKVGAISPGTVWISEHVAVPVGETLERLGPPPFGQSVVAEARIG